MTISQYQYDEAYGELRQAFHAEWDDLDRLQRKVVAIDYAQCPDNVLIYRQNIGRGNLLSYANVVISQAAIDWANAQVTP